MSLSGNLILNLYSIAILTIIFVHALKSTERNLLQQKLFLRIIQLTVLMLAMDVLSRFDGGFGALYTAANHIGNFLIFLLGPVLPALWLLYVLSQVNDSDVKLRKWLIILSVLAAVNTALLVLSQFYGWFYDIDAGNIYHRGPLYLFPVLETVVLTVITFFLVVLNRRQIERKHLISLLLFPVPPLVCIVLQIAYYGLSLILNGAALSILIAFATIQTQRMNTDFLTGAYNRKGLELYIRQKINASSETRTFSAILLDLDNFKTINDSFGHSTGDEVLVTAVRLLKSCLRPGEFIARYGGDEFYLILNISDADELGEAVRRIGRCVDSYNAGNDKPYKLGVSMGCAVYNYALHQTAEEFQKHLDALMYERKRTHREK